MIELPVTVREDVARILGAATDALRVEPVSGGCISPAARVSAGARSVFVKWSVADTPDGLFVQEAVSLRALGTAGVVRVPRVLHADTSSLVLEWLEAGQAGVAQWRAFGVALARLHRVRGPAFGWAQDNFIGPLQQANAWTGSWPEFYQRHRIAPQIERAFAAGAFDRSQRQMLERFHDELSVLLPHEPVPSLLHGDLWSGNVHALASGELALIDPASCYGDREMDLAMAALFGGFPHAFFESYEREWATPAASREQRRAAYQVYYLLVHVNLFGVGYAARTMAAATMAVG